MGFWHASLTRIGDQRCHGSSLRTARSRCSRGVDPLSFASFSFTCHALSRYSEMTLSRMERGAACPTRFRRCQQRSRFLETESFAPLMLFGAF